MAKRGTILFMTALALAVPAGITGWNALQSDAGAPDFTLVSTGVEAGANGTTREFSLSEFRGQTVVLDFMAYNCGSCRHVTPKVEQLWHDVDNGTNHEIQFLTIDVGEFANFPGSTVENLIRWQTQDFDSPWIHAVDTEGVFLDYADACVGGIPCLFILDGEGRFIFQNTGIPDVREMRAAIDASLAGDADTVSVLSVGVIGLALVAGIASFFAPCSVGLLPAYLGFLLQDQSGQPGAGAAPHATGRALRGGLTTAAGIVSLYGVLAVILWWFSDALAPVIPKLGLITGVLLVLVGLLMFWGGAWDRVAAWMGMGKVDGRKGFFAFGVGYGLAAFGCTGPVFLPVLVAGFADGPVLGFTAFLVYTLAVSSFVVFAAYLVAAGQQTRLRALLSKTALITKISAVLMIGAGAYLIWFDWVAFG